MTDARRIALASCRELPEPDPDAPLLVDALARRGLSPEILAWDDPEIDWSSSRAVVIRSTWDYYRARSAFLAWTERVAGAARLYNAPDVVRYSTHKSYLADLVARGIATVPTAFVPRGSGEDLAALMDARGWRDVVVKPQVSAGSFETHRFSRDALRGGELAALAKDRETMVQPYVASVDGYGERAIVWIDGAVTHAVRKSPRFAGGAESVEVVPVADDERAFAERAVARAPFSDLLYARVDLARDERGGLMVMELELVEPSLFFREGPAGLERFADAILLRAG